MVHFAACIVGCTFNAGAKQKLLVNGNGKVEGTEGMGMFRRVWSSSRRDSSGDDSGVEEKEAQQIQEVLEHGTGDVGLEWTPDQLRLTLDHMAEEAAKEILFAVQDKEELVRSGSGDPTVDAQNALLEATLKLAQATTRQAMQAERQLQKALGH